MAILLKDRGLNAVHAASLEKAHLLLARHVFPLMVCELLAIAGGKHAPSENELITGDCFSHIPKLVVSQGEPVLPPMIGRTTYFSKTDRPALADKIKQCFEEWIPNNFKLEIRLSEHLPPSLRRLSELVDPDALEDAREYICQELDFVFSGLFHHETWAQLDEVFWHVPGRLALLAQAGQENQQRQNILVIVGEKELLALEQNAFHDHGYGRQGLRTIESQEHFAFGRLAMHTYIIQDADHHKLCRLGDFFQYASAKSLEHVYKVLCEETLPGWRLSGGEQIDAINWLRGHEVGSGLRALEQGDPFLANVCAALDRVGFSIPFDQHKLSFGQNKAEQLPAPGRVWDVLKKSSLDVEMAVSPGNLNGLNMLTDGSGVWLTDFLAAGFAPSCLDYAVLEAMLRFDLIPSSTKQSALMNLEKKWSLGRFNDLACPHDDWQKNFTCIGIIRKRVDAAAIPAYQFTMFCLVLHRLWLYREGEEQLPGGATRLFHLVYAAGLIGDVLMK